MAVKIAHSVTAQLWYSMAVEQHSCEPALRHDSFSSLHCSVAVWLLSSETALVRSGKTASVLQFQPTKQSLVKTKSLLHWDRGDAGLRREECPPPFPNWSISMHMGTLNLHSLVQIILSWLVRMVPFWLVGEDDVQGSLSLIVWNMALGALKHTQI